MLRSERTLVDMKNKNTWGVIGVVVLAGIMALAGWYSAVIAMCVLLAIVRLIRGLFSYDGLIGVDHVDRPHSRTYGAGYSPGGLFGVSGTGAHFGVFGVSGAEIKSPRKEYAAVLKPALSKKQHRELAAAIKEAEARTGHQILASIGSLNEDRAAKADRIAAEWPAASIVVCIDPARKLCELRWRDANSALDTTHTAAFVERIRNSEFAAAITLLAELLPTHTPGAELPDIVEE